MSQIRVQGVSKHYDDVTVLQDVNLTIPHGAVMALLGPSGCGKTTLLRLIAGFDRIASGTISFDDKAVASSDVYVAPERRHIGYVPQEGALFPHLTVAGNVGYGLSRRNNQKTRIQEVLALTGLEGFGERFPHELSGGQQQRVALARALAPDPALILLDEPFNALDLDLRRSMCEDVVAMLRKTGTTAILVTHDPGEAFAVADLVAVMQGGKIMQCAQPEQVYWQPLTPTVARLTGASVFLRGKSQGDEAICPLGRLPMYPRKPHHDGDVWVMLRPEQISVAREGEGVVANVTHSSFRGDHSVLNVLLDNVHFGLRAPSLSAPLTGSEIFLSVHGSCMAFAA